jgi:hypothetical protein
MELLLPVALMLFPGMLPSTFITTSEREVKMKRALQVKKRFQITTGWQILYFYNLSNCCFRLSLNMPSFCKKHWTKWLLLTIMTDHQNLPGIL